MLKYLKAREYKIKLLYTLNAFRAVQKRVTLEMREMGTRDRVMGDCMYLGPMENPGEALNSTAQKRATTDRES